MEEEISLTMDNILLFYCINCSFTYDQEFLKWLTSEQVIRASKFHFERDKNIYILSHALLNRLITKFYNKNINEIPFIRNKFHKPYIKKSNLFFNLSHSHNSWCIGLNTNELGVDIEEINQNFNYQDIIQQYFSHEDIINIYSHETFIKAWTRKEALLKAAGVGLGFSNPNTISISGEFNDFKGLKYYNHSFQFNNAVISLASEIKKEITLVEITHETFYKISIKN